jgi:hypothetical protein
MDKAPIFRKPKHVSVVILTGVSLFTASVARGQAQTGSNAPANSKPNPTNSAGNTNASPTTSAEPNSPILMPSVVVTASKPGVAEATIDPNLGVRVYTIDAPQIQNMPQGEETTFAEVVERSPGVSEDAYGTWHVRGEDTDTSYLLNGVRIPLGIVNSTFGQKFDTHFINSVSLLDGALPAQYGLWTGGIFDITSKQGSQLAGGDASIYGGSYNTLRANVSYGGVVSNIDYFVQGSYDGSDLGIENPTASSYPIHDHTDQFRGFVYVCDHLDPSSEIFFILNGSDATFQIPDTEGIPVAYTLPGMTYFNSADLNETQIEQYHYGILSYKKQMGNFDIQSSLISSFAQTWYRPDWIGDLMINGLASEQKRGLIENTWATDASYEINDQHTLKAGVYLTSQLESATSTTTAFPTDPSGAVTSDVPVTIQDGQNKDGYLSGAYLADQWRPIEQLTINYGLRFDQVNEFVSENQVSPRVNLVYQATPATAFFAGYSRFFVPAQLEYLPPSSLQKYLDTTAAPSVTTDDAPKAERSHYFDVGLTQRITKDWKFGVEGYYKLVRNMADEAQVGNSEIYVPFSYDRGYYVGGEFSSSYAKNGFSAFANLELNRAMGTDINSSEFLFGQDELNYTAQHYVHLNHDQTITLSTGAAYTYQNTTFHVDALYGSGFYDGFADMDKVSEHCPVNFGVKHDFHLGHHQIISLRCDVINAFDEIYVFHHGAGIGTTAPYYGERRGIFGGVDYKF